MAPARDRSRPEKAHPMSLIPRRPWLPAHEVQRIGVFRALVLGDLLCAQPALRALRAAYPGARITLIGLPWAEALVGRLPELDDLLPFPGWPGLPETPPRLSALPGFFIDAQAQGFDLLLQLHGSGRLINPLVAALGARHLACFASGDALQPEGARCLPWPEHGHEIERCLALTDHLGLPRQGLQLSLSLRPQDHAEADALLQGLPSDRPLVLVHPGAQLPSRRWPVDRFAAVARALAADGCQLAITGTAGEAPLAAALKAALGPLPVLDLVGRTGLWTLAAVVARARLVVSNDTGVSHLAAALHTPSVVVASGSEVSRWAPLDRARHPVLWADAPCRPCAHRDCPSGHECALAVAPDSVLAQARRLLVQVSTASPTPCPAVPCAS
jgi:ADP-heptose:LPS heptosyltransferase